MGAHNINVQLIYISDFYQRCIRSTFQGVECSVFILSDVLSNARFHAWAFSQMVLPNDQFICRVKTKNWKWREKIKITAENVLRRNNMDTLLNQIKAEKETKK